MKTIKIKVRRNGDIDLAGGKFEPKELINILVETLVYEICILKKPDVDLDDLYISTCNSIGQLMDKRYNELCAPPKSFEWEVV